MNLYLYKVLNLYLYTILNLYLYKLLNLYNILNLCLYKVFNLYLYQMPPAPNWPAVSLYFIQTNSNILPQFFAFFVFLYFVFVHITLNWPASPLIQNDHSQIFLINYCICIWTKFWICICVIFWIYICIKCHLRQIDGPQLPLFNLIIRKHSCCSSIFFAEIIPLLRRNFPRLWKVSNPPHDT